METVGSATAVVTLLGSGVLVVGYLPDQVPALSEKAAAAIKALRYLRDVWRGKDEGDESCGRR
ncbi:hypothetical protein AB0A70_00505 [Streptomyces morookaense]|uniref:hypothetical protein n=1 Tax=Streptomyces morookaense TaxID=1970 RepID=UPI0033D29C7D